MGTHIYSAYMHSCCSVEKPGCGFEWEESRVILSALWQVLSLERTVSFCIYIDPY